MKLKLLLSTLLLISSVFLFGCNKSLITGSGLNKEFKVKFGESAEVAGTNISIKFANVLGDSRCPKDVNCIRAGEATIQIDFMKDGKQIGNSVILGTIGGKIPSAKAVDQYLIKLLDLEPYPLSTKKIEKVDYVASLKIENLKVGEK